MATTSVPEWRSESKDAFQYMLLAQWLRVKPAQPAGTQTETIAKIDSILGSDDASWNDLNLVEVLLVDFDSEATLEEAIQTRLGEMLRRGIVDAEVMAARHKAMMAHDPLPSLETRRAFFADILHAIQHFNLRSAQIRRMRAKAIRMVSITAVVGMILAVLPLLAALVHHNAPGSSLDALIVATVRNFPNYGLYTTVTFGMLGALFSRFVSLQTSYVGVPIHDADVFYRYENIILRIFLGTLAAVIIYFFVSSGILAGEIVPNVSKLGFQTVQSGDSSLLNVIGDDDAVTHAIVPTKDFALLVIWAFIAGFSEKLVPDLLSATTTRIGKTDVPAASQATVPTPQAGRTR
jgi:hypothetical protein